MTRGEQIIKEAKRIIAEAHERGDNDPMVDLAVTLSFSLGARWADKNPDIDVRTMAAWQSGYNEGIAKSRWISVEDELPPKDNAYLAYWQHYGVTKYRYVKAGAKVSRTFSEHITHWMPLPQPPLVTDLNKKDLPPVSWQEGNILVKEKGEEG